MTISPPARSISEASALPIREAAAFHLAPGGIVRIRPTDGEDLVVAAHGGFLSVTAVSPDHRTVLARRGPHRQVCDRPGRPGVMYAAQNQRTTATG